MMRKVSPGRRYMSKARTKAEAARIASEVFKAMKWIAIKQTAIQGTGSREQPGSLRSHP